MSQRTTIEWTDATWNPWQGCTKVSEGCAHCYMYAGMDRFQMDPTIVRRSASRTFNLPLTRRRNGEYVIEAGARIFTCSWSDWWHTRADQWRDEAWSIIRQRPDVTFQIVTKRPERSAAHLPADWGPGWDNVWLLVSAETQARLDERMPYLLSVPAAVRGVSYEPALAAVDFSDWLGYVHEDAIGTTNTHEPFGGPWHDPWIRGVDWIIAGGESGSNARPCDQRWLLAVAEQCRATNTPLFVKQLGANAGEMSGGEWTPRRYENPKGGDPDEWPEELRVREFPTLER